MQTSNQLPADGSGQLTFLGVANLLLRHRRMMIVLPLSLAALVALHTILRSTPYEAESKFLAGATSGATGLSSLAQQFGLGAQGEAGGAFYAQLLKSRAVLRATATTQYTVVNAEDSTKSLTGDLPSLYEVEGDTEEGRIRGAMNMLMGATTASQDLESGIITLKTKAPWGQLAVAINRRMLDYLNEFNLTTRQSTASAERTFAEKRRDETRAELDGAELAMREFLEQNRTYRDSPRLTFEAARLQANIDLLRQVHNSLAQAAERARIDEVRNTPVLTVLDVPEGSARPVSNWLVMRVMLALILGFLVALGIAAARDFLRTQRTRSSAEFVEFEELSASALAAVNRLPAVRRFGLRSARSSAATEVR